MVLRDTANRICGLLPGRVRGEDVDLRTLYEVRGPNGNRLPGRILETHRLWELPWSGGVPFVSDSPRPLRERTRVVGFLAIADYTVGAGSEEHLQLLREAPTLVLVDDPGQARAGLEAYSEEMSRLGEPDHLGGWTVQARTFIRRVTVVDPYAIRPLR